MHKIANKFHYIIVSIKNIFSLILINIYCILITTCTAKQITKKQTKWKPQKQNSKSWNLIKIH